MRLVRILPTLGFLALLAAILFMAYTPGYSQNKMPKILNPGDTAIATVPVWIQTLDSEIDQRLELKTIRNKLSTYVKQTGEIDRISSDIEQIQKERDHLLQLTNKRHQEALNNMSLLVDSCATQLGQSIQEMQRVENDRDRLKSGRNTWRGIAVALVLGLAGAFAL
jgi:hypothetical protein